MKLSIALWVAVFAAASPVTARELVHRSQLVSSSPDAQGVVVVPRFDPSFGVLQRVRIDLRLGLDGRIGLEHLATLPGQVSVDLLEEFELLLPGEVNPLGVGVQAGASVFLPAFDGAVDFTGTSGTVMPAALAQQRPFALTEGLDRFIATATNTSLNLELELDGEFSFGPDTAGRAAVVFTAEVELTYVFEPHDAGRPRRVASATQATGAVLDLLDPRSRAQVV